MIVTFSSFVSCATRAVAFAYAYAHAPSSTFSEDKSPSLLESVVVLLKDVEFWAIATLGSNRAPRRRLIFFMMRRMSERMESNSNETKVSKGVACVRWEDGLLANKQ